MTWLTVHGELVPEMEERCSRTVQEKIRQGNFKQEDVEYLKAHELPLLGKQLFADEQSLEKLRQLAKCWDVELAPFQITSHRRFVGPFIVFAKKILFRVFAVQMEQSVKRQRDFNAKTVELMIALHSKPHA